MPALLALFNHFQRLTIVKFSWGTGTQALWKLFCDRNGGFFRELPICSNSFFHNSLSSGVSFNPRSLGIFPPRANRSNDPLTPLPAYPLTPTQVTISIWNRRDSIYPLPLIQLSPPLPLTEALKGFSLSSMSVTFFEGSRMTKAALETMASSWFISSPSSCLFYSIFCSRVLRSWVNSFHN